MHEVEELRKKILFESYVNGTHNKEGPLFKRIKIKKQTVDYALEKMLEEKLFTKTKYELDLNTVGIGKFAWVLMSINWESYNSSDFIKKLLGLTQVVTVADVTGTSDVAVKIFGPSINNISAFILLMEKLFQGTITDTQVHFANIEYKRHYFAVGKKTAYKPTRADCAILHEKMNNSKITLGEIAEKHKLHRNTVSKKWEKLWSRGVIVKELPDLTQEGYDELKMGLKAFIIIKPVPGKEEKIVKNLLKNKEIQDIFTTLSNEIVVILRTENSQTLASIHRNLTKIDSSVKRTSTSIFLTKYNKNTLSLPEIKGLVNGCANL